MALYEIDTDTTLYKVAAAVLLFLAVLIIVITVSSWLIGEKWNANHQLHIPESGVTMLIGIVIGGILRLSAINTESAVEHELVAFSPPLFFLGFLPPIIFNEGHHLDKALFFAHLTPILIFAMLGTAISTVVVAYFLKANTLVGIARDVSFAEAGTFGALISATDPVAVLAAFSSLRVEPTLFFLVFGESVLNDAVSLTMFTIASQFVGAPQESTAILKGVFDFAIIMIGSSVIGWLCGIAMAFALKTAKMRQARVLELALYGTTVYYPYMTAQVVGMSGIVSILVAGITARHYAFRNLSSDDERDLADFMFRLFSFLADNATFIYLGLAVFSVKVATDFNAAFIFWSLLACLVGRAAGVFGLSFCINSTSRYTGMARIGWRTQAVMWFAGLRGAVAFAASTTFPDAFGNRDLFITTTMAIIIIFTFVIAPFTVPLLRYLKIPTGVDYRQVTVPKLNKTYTWIGRMDAKYVEPVLCKKSAPDRHSTDSNLVPSHPPRQSRHVPPHVAMAALRAAAEQRTPQPDLPVSAFADDAATLQAGRHATATDDGYTDAPIRNTEMPDFGGGGGGGSELKGPEVVSSPTRATRSAPTTVHLGGPPGLGLSQLHLRPERRTTHDTLTEWIEQSLYDFGGPVSPRQPAVDDIVSAATRRDDAWGANGHNTA